MPKGKGIKNKKKKKKKGKREGEDYKNSQLS
jgi:hypothetical protein